MKRKYEELFFNATGCLPIDRILEAVADVNEPSYAERIQIAANKAAKLWQSQAQKIDKYFSVDKKGVARK